MICSVCKKNKKKKYFRIRTDKRRNPPLIYPSNICLKCEAEKQKERTKRERATPEGRKKHNQWAKEFHVRHRDKVLAYGKARRKTAEFKRYMKKYRKRNKEKIAKQEKITKRRYQEKHMNALTDLYVKSKLGFTKNEEVPKEIIEAKRMQLKLVRTIHGRN